MFTPFASGTSIESQARVAADLIKKCVHCGFCLPACPTYQLLGEELDSPRGRIYLIKQLAEGRAPSAISQRHLDRCLTCRSCESACPSGVEYGRLIDVGREMVEARRPRPWRERAQRALLGTILSSRTAFAMLLGVGRLLRPLLPRALAARVPAPRAAARWPGGTRARSMILLEGCVQPALAPDIDGASARLLDSLGVTLERAPRAGCCGALNHHLGREAAARAQARRNIDAWVERLDAGASAIVVTASGCGSMLKDYERWFADDPQYAQKAARVSAASRDLSEVVEPAALAAAGIGDGGGRRVAWQSPCSLQHGQRIRGRVEALLAAAGFTVLVPEDSTRCCGSAGTYSLLQPAIAQQLRGAKVATLCALEPDVIATANIGCLEHLSSAAPIPVRHWVELLAPATSASEPQGRGNPPKRS